MLHSFNMKKIHLQAGKKGFARVAGLLLTWVYEKPVHKHSTPILTISGRGTSFQQLQAKSP